jgi:hypothetical protein
VLDQGETTRCGDDRLAAGRHLLERRHAVARVAWSNRAAGTCADARPICGEASDVGGRVMSAWEYLIVSLPEFEPARAAQGESSAVMLLNHEGGNGWEAVAMTPLRDGSFAVLLKRPVKGPREV